MSAGPQALPIAGLVVVGARGRMGRRLCALSSEYGLDIAAEVDVRGQPSGPSQDVAGLTLDEVVAEHARCVIDFSVVDQATATLRWCAAHKVPAVIGTTGLGAAQEEALALAAREAPVVWAPNFSLGVHVLLELVSEAARLLDDGWDIEVVEAHHRKKVDAPSGTALALAQRVAAARGAGLEEVMRNGRAGLVGPRPRGELGVHALRGGSVIGEHTVSFFGDGEVVTLEHRALDRDIFARGALRAAAWLTSESRAPGRYGLADVLRSA